MFSQHVVDHWNNEKRELVQARNSSGFKVKRRSDRRNLGGNRTLFQRLYVVGGMV